jgi:ribosomal-protein-alanine N-acetyltransferase
VAGEPLELPGGRLDDGVVAVRTGRPEDAADLARGVRDPAVVRFASVSWAPDTIPELAERIATLWPEGARDGTRLDVVIANAADDTVLGYLVVFGINRRHGHCEVGFFLNPDARGRGAVSRAVDLVCRWAFADGFHRVHATTHVDNAAAQRALVKAGFALEGVLRGYVTSSDGSHHDFQMYSRLAGD